MQTKIMLTEVFQKKDHDYDALQRLVRNKIKNKCKDSICLVNKSKGTTTQIDLNGKTFILNKPLELTYINLIVLTNGTLIAGPDFPKDEYLISVKSTHGLELRHLFLECSKRANGIYFEDFMRVRVEDCYIVHQKSYGIYSSATGNNHELEIFKCHISEFLFGDGYPKKIANYGVIPEFDVDKNRQSTGIFLGQADNVVADCNINLCRVGIFSGMRANRIHGNHITGGGSKSLEVFKGIELNNFHKSSAMIVNNYVDNCCLWINCSADEKKNLRNYIHVTDNLFYRGYNHPKEGNEEYHHIVINPMEKDSLIANLHICDNLFYSQPENLDGIKPRIITPIHVRQSDADAEVKNSMDHKKLIGLSIKNNHFTNDYPTFVVPMGTNVVKEVDITNDLQLYTVSFDNQIPLGVIHSAHVSVSSFEGDVPPMVSVKEIINRSVTFYAKSDEKATVQVEVFTDNRYSKRFDYIVR